MYIDSGVGGEFWWLSPSPPSSSTPKEGTPKERTVPSPHHSLSPKLRRSIARRASSSPTSPVLMSKIKSTSSPSTKSSFERIDPKTAELQERAKALLEKRLSMH
ncbi:uncharacterized protein LOC111332148 [Stylophora pistillata]|uniref:uncharacterized protein LOC111332148 n=1 Tax=Stylophora pistillata TaxID=50429 RepID=UPI000C04D267|nr:uncharacterized protein LOC111332148 [Stylophora pistillata]